MPTQAGIGFGMILLLWPLTIPARSILLTGRAAKRVLSPTRMVAEGDHLCFITNPMDLNYRINKDSVRDVIRRKEYMCIELWKFKLVYVPLKALNDPDDLKKLRKFVGAD